MKENLFSNPGLSPSGMRAPVRQHTQTDRQFKMWIWVWSQPKSFTKRGETKKKNLEKLPIKRVLKWQCAASVNSVLITFCQKLTFSHALCLLIGFLSYKINIFFFSPVRHFGILNRALEAATATKLTANSQITKLHKTKINKMSSLCYREASTGGSTPIC